MHIELKILDQRLNEWGLPHYQTSKSAGVDLFACLSETLMIPAGSPATLIATGIAIHMDFSEMMAIIVPRSGMGHKKGLVLGNSIGIIDADYTGQIFVSAWNRNAVGTEPIRIEAGERIAQLIFMPILRPQYTIVTEFSQDSQRGTGGFGSTG